MTDLRTQDEIMSSWKGDIREPLVTVRCMTYNHEPYIEDAIKGFLIQETDFPFQVLIHDDASTDNTAAIVKKYEKEYPLIIKGWYQSCNTKSMPRSERSVMRKPFFDLLTAKYQAICEGDDYWTDPNKLQMQVDFLENKPEYGMCFTRARQYDQKKKEFLPEAFGSPVKSFSDLLNNGNRIPTLTVCMRKSIFDQYVVDINPRGKKWLMGDYPVWLYIAKHSGIHFMDNVTGVYRVLPQSLSHFLEEEKRVKFVHSTFDIVFYFAKKYKERLDINIALQDKLLFDAYKGSDVPVKYRIQYFFLKNDGILLCYNRIHKLFRRALRMARKFCIIR